MVVVVSSYIFCVLLLFTCRGKVHIGKRTKIFVQKFLRMIGCKNGGFRNLSCLCTALLITKVSVSVSFIYVLKLVELSALLARQYLCEFGPSYLLPNGLKLFYLVKYISYYGMATEVFTFYFGRKQILDFGFSKTEFIGKLKNFTAIYSQT